MKKEVVENIHEKVSQAENNLQTIQEQIDTYGHTETLLNEQKAAQITLEDVLDKQEAFWREKAKVKWHLEGDRNTNYFHTIAKIKSKTKQITSIRDNEQLMTEPGQIVDHITNHFENIFCSSVVLQDSNLVEEVIPNIISESTNKMLTMIPTKAEIKNAVFALHKQGAPGPDGFGGIFFQTYWEIVKTDVENAVLEFFIKSWIMPNFNANTLILIPKIPNADKVGHYRPIALANFKFKIISKILADRLATIMPSFISPEQKGFIQGRQIRDCICITSEAINLLPKKCFGGNLAFKVDIAKAFDTIEWPFLLKVLKSFGFDQKFCKWIEVILESASLSISINGTLHGYFKCKRGVRQGDPLSPLLFCIAEDVLIRAITQLVVQGKLQLITSSRNFQVPSHVLYADDIMLFCKGNISGIHALRDLFLRYVECSGQFINPAKSTIFSGSISQSRLNQLVNLLGFNAGSLPFTYLGVPIFKGKPNSIFLQPLVDKIKQKLAAWKASLLSIAGRIQLVKSVIYSMLTHSITIYSWPISLLKDVEKCVRNFIWSGDVNKRKLVTVAWHKVCKPLDEGGLGIRSLTTLNEASNLKLCWELLSSNQPWATLLRNRAIPKGKPVSYHIHSSLWSSCKSEYSTCILNSQMLLGSGNSINFWKDTWCGPPLSVALNLPPAAIPHLSSYVSDFISDFVWSIPHSVQMTFPNLRNIVSKIIIPKVTTNDKLIWIKSNSGDLTLKDAFMFKSDVGQKSH